MHPPPRPPCACKSFCGEDSRVRLGSSMPCAAVERLRLVRALETSRKHIADRACICDIESSGTLVELGGVRYYDVRPMLDAREVSPECMDMASEAIAYALAEGLVLRHPQLAYLLRVVAQP